MIALTILILTVSSHASDVESVYNNKQGVKSLMKGQALAAKDDFLKALENEPQEAQLHLNLGLAYQAAKDNERALKEYQAGIRFTQNPDMKFYGNFNSAQVIGTKDVDLALRYYQEALKYRPDSQETKHNIELLMQGKGGGGGSDEDSKQQPNGENEDKGQDRSNKQSNEPQPYKGKELSEQDVQNILEELKNQDQKVRAKENSTGKDRGLDKDW